MPRQSDDSMLALPASVQVTQALRTDIAQGRFKIGDRLPTRRELCDQYGIAAMTAAKVIRALTDEGTVRSVPGRGVFVVAVPDPDLPRPPVAPVSSSALEARLRGIEARLAQLEQHVLDRFERGIT